MWIKMQREIDMCPSLCAKWRNRNRFSRTSKKCFRCRVKKWAGNEGAIINNCKLKTNDRFQITVLALAPTRTTPTAFPLLILQLKTNIMRSSILLSSALFLVCLFQGCVANLDTTGALELQREARRELSNSKYKYTTVCHVRVWCVQLVGKWWIVWWSCGPLSTPLPPLPNPSIANCSHRTKTKTSSSLGIGLQCIANGHRHRHQHQRHIKRCISRWRIKR